MPKARGEKEYAEMELCFDNKLSAVRAQLDKLHAKLEDDQGFSSRARYFKDKWKRHNAAMQLRYNKLGQLIKGEHFNAVEHAKK